MQGQYMLMEKLKLGLQDSIMKSCRTMTFQSLLFQPQRNIILEVCLEITQFSILSCCLQPSPKRARSYQPFNTSSFMTNSTGKEQRLKGHTNITEQKLHKNYMAIVKKWSMPNTKGCCTKGACSGCWYTAEPYTGLCCESSWALNPVTL